MWCPKDHGLSVEEKPRSSGLQKKIAGSEPHRCFQLESPTWRTSLTLNHAFSSSSFEFKSIDLDLKDRSKKDRRNRNMAWKSAQRKNARSSIALTEIPVISSSLGKRLTGLMNSERKAGSVDLKHSAC